MLPTTEKDSVAIETAKTLQNIPWGDEYERMISGMMYAPIPSAPNSQSPQLQQEQPSTTRRLY
jgi:hypothetical protein